MICTWQQESEPSELPRALKTCPFSPPLRRSEFSMQPRCLSSQIPSLIDRCAAKFRHAAPSGAWMWIRFHSLSSLPSPTSVILPAQSQCLWQPIPKKPSSYPSLCTTNATSSCVHFKTSSVINCLIISSITNLYVWLKCAVNVSHPESSSTSNICVVVLFTVHSGTQDKVGASSRVSNERLHDGLQCYQRYCGYI